MTRRRRRVRHKKAVALATMALLGGGAAVADSCTCTFPGAQPPSPTPPVLSTAIVAVSGATLTMTYNEALDTGSVPAGARFTVTVDGIDQSSPTATQVTGSTVVLTLAANILQAQTVLLDYTAAANPIQDLLGADAANLVDQAVTNNSTQTGGAVANLWMDGSGSCTRSSSPAAYNSATACNNLDAVLAACQGGDTVKITSGSYGDQQILGDAGRTSMCAISASSGATISFDEIENGFGQSDTGDDFYSLTGPGITIRTVSNDQATNITYDQIIIDGAFAGSGTGGCCQIFHVEDTPNFTFKNGQVKNACSFTGLGGMSYIAGNSTGFVFTNNTVHDARLCDPAGDPHSECFYITGVDGVTFTRNHLYACAVMDVFITGDNGDGEADDYFIENNIFEDPCQENTSSPGTCTPAPGALAFHFRDGSTDPRPNPNNWDVRFNTFIGSMDGCSAPNECGAAGMRLRGNVFIQGNPCGNTGVTSTYNAFTGGTCGSNSITNTTGTYNSGWTGGSARYPSNTTLLTGSVLKNAGPTTDFPTTDKAGTARVSPADIGAYEFP